MAPPLLSSTPFTLCMINYNGERYLEDSLGAVLVLQAGGNEILLIDNASSDKSLDIVKQKFPTVRIIQLIDNRGPGAARNVGFRAAANDLILFLDNDVILTPNCPAQLINALKDHPEAVAAMPRVLYARNRSIIQYEGADCHFLGLMTLRNAGQLAEDCVAGVRHMNSLVTACFLIDRNRWGLTKPFDEDFFTFYEDHDFGVRARVWGHQLLSISIAHAFHREGTEGLSYRPGGSYSRLRTYYLIRNRWQMIMKNYALKTILLLSPLLLVYELFQFTGVIRKGWFWEWRGALCWIMKNLPHLLRKRAFVQANRKTADHEILDRGPLPFTPELTSPVIDKLGKTLLDAIATGYWQIVRKVI